MTALLLMPTQFIFSTCNETLYYYKEDKNKKINIRIIMINLLLLFCYNSAGYISCSVCPDLVICDRFVELPLFLMLFLDLIV